MLWLPCLIAFAACAPHASNDDGAAALLHVSARAELTLARSDEATLIPALTFYNHERRELHIVDLELHGTFPTQFSIDVDAPPPPDALVSSSTYLDEPELAVGYITAVTPGHPDTIALGRSTGDRPRSSADGPAVTASTWCVDDGSECYTEMTSCPSVDAAPEQCQLSSVGDPQLKRDPGQYIAGLSENYAVVYFPDAVPADGFTGYYFGATSTLAAGYHLLALTANPDPDAVGRCVLDATELAAERYNQQNGSHYSVADLSSDQCDGVSCDPHVIAQFTSLFQLAEVELDCPKDVEITPVEQPERATISLRFSADLAPLGV